MKSTCNPMPSRMFRSIRASVVCSSVPSSSWIRLRFAIDEKHRAYFPDAPRIGRSVAAGVSPSSMQGDFADARSGLVIPGP